MNLFRGPAALLIALACCGPVGAQVPIYPGVHGTSGLFVGGLYRGGRLNVGFSAYLPGRYGYGYYAPFYPAGYVNRTTIVQLYTPPPIVIAPALPRFAFVNEPVLAPGQRVPLIEAPPRDPLPEGRPLPGEPAGVFRPIRPEDRARAQQPMLPEVPPPPDVPRPPDVHRPPVKPVPPPKARPPEQLPLPPQPQANPRAEAARLIALGRDAFANQEYGRAAHRFRQAMAAAPDESLPHFLHAQALLALDKYAQAVEAIHEGMRRQFDWPQVRFRPQELYEPDLAGYREQLHRLEEVLSRHPDDPILLFLYGHQLWFDGRKDEARVLFQRAAPRARDRTFIDRFLKALPAPPVA